MYGYGANKRQLKGHLYYLTQKYKIISLMTTNVYVYCIKTTFLQLLPTR